MKKILFVFTLGAMLTSCHYGADDARKTLDTNEEYKTEKADYSVNSANVEPAKVETLKDVSDTTKTAE